ncbi:MAG: lytic transglycosylase domain-containing protein [bacterium]|nr:lytic transglycosylase domain-containing protein [bacterium]
MNHKQVSICAVVFSILWALLFISLCDANSIDVVKICIIESSYRPDAHNIATNARGIMQITKPCLTDYNMYNVNKQYSMDDMFKVAPNVVVGTWYLNKRIPELLRHYEIKDSKNNRLMCYNWGIGNVVKHYREGKSVPRETLDYIEKYRRLKI